MIALLALLLAGHPGEPLGLLTVDASSIGEVGADRAIAHQLHQLHRRRAALLATTAPIERPRLALRVTVESLSAPAIGYVSTIEASASEGPQELRTLRCELCTEGELVAQLAAAVDGLHRGLRAAPDDPRGDRPR